MPIDINLTCSDILSTYGTLTVAQLILKHILYQRQQVPLQVEALQRDAAKSIDGERLQWNCNLLNKQSQPLDRSGARLTKQLANERIRNAVSLQHFVLQHKITTNQNEV